MCENVFQTSFTLIFQLEIPTFRKITYVKLTAFLAIKSKLIQTVRIFFQFSKGSGSLFLICLLLNSYIMYTFANFIRFILLKSLSSSLSQVPQVPSTRYKFTKKPLKRFKQFAITGKTIFKWIMVVFQKYLKSPYRI